MKKTILASLILASSASFAADHAVLNVEGEIQINGKTVIDQNGRLTTQDQTVVNLQDYEQATGTYTYSMVRTVGYDGNTEVCDITETISETSADYDEVCTSKVYSYSTENPNYNPDFYPTYEEQQACEAVDCWSETIWVESSDAIRTTSYKDSYINTDVGEDRTWEYKSTIEDNERDYTFTEYHDESRESLAITPLSDYNPWYVIGSVISNTDKVTNLDSSETYYYQSISSSSEKLTNVTVNDQFYASCLISDGNYGDYYNENLELRCEGAGYLMASIDDISTGAVPAKSSRLNKPMTQVEHRTTRANYDKVRQLRNKKLEQLKNKQPKK
jgi:hypothetical protein